MPDYAAKFGLNNQVIPKSTATSPGKVTAAAFLALAAMDIDLMTAFSAVAATIGNVGPAFGAVGPSHTYGALPELAKWILSFCMLAGRLEIYTLIILFVPEFWKK